MTGFCVHNPTPMTEIANLEFSSESVITWPPVPGAIYYNTYRGAIASNGFTGYNESYFEWDDSHGDGALVAIDTAMPASQTASYYLVSHVTACGEGPVGKDSDGTIIPHAQACP